MVLPEYEGYTVEEIIKCIDSDISKDVPLDDIDPRIENSQTEMKGIIEKLIRYDAHFKARNPKLSTEHLLVKLHIDFEVQNDYRPRNPAYPIVKRGIYYSARELSSQLGRLTAATDFANLEKVYSIWICNENIPENERNTISAYHMERKDILGHIVEDESEYDLMTVVIIRRGKKTDENGIWDYLQGVFDSDIKTMKKYSDVSWSSKLEQEVHRMCGLGESIYQKGTLEGRIEGRREMIATMLSAGKTPEEIASFANIPIEEVKEVESTLLTKIYIT